jgi:hypothetical protein
MRVLNDKFPGIVDVIEPGGSGDMYAGLTVEQRDALAEVTRMGFPAQTWFTNKTLGPRALQVLIDSVVMVDPRFFTDFWYVWNQFRSPDGKPIFPQRKALTEPLLAYGGAGSVQSSKVTGKMIVVDSLMDEAAFPWQADWYRSKVKDALGDRLDDNFRLWFTKHALHTDVDQPADRTRVVSYVGVLCQALRDLSAWVEKGVPLPTSTSYRVVDGQVVVPATAVEHKGIQPAVNVQANGGGRAEVTAGQPVQFTASIGLPPNTGKIVGAEWDFEGAGNCPASRDVNAPGASDDRLTLSITYTFTKPGTYFPALRATSKRRAIPEHLTHES